MTDVRLITRGDDAGGCGSANFACHEGITRGILRNVGLMANGLAIEQAAPMYRGIRDVDFGVHLCLNAEWDAVRWGPVLPAAKVPSLVEPDGTLTRTPMVLHERKASLDEQLAEAQAQIDKLRKLGFNVVYLDEHMGVGWQNGLRDGLRKLCEKEGLIDTHDLPTKPAYPKERTDDPAGAIASFLSSAEPGLYMNVTHPGADRPDMQAYGHTGLEPGRIAREREMDRRMLTDPRLVELCKTKVRLTRFSECRSEVRKPEPPSPTA